FLLAAKISLRFWWVIRHVQNLPHSGYCNQTETRPDFKLRHYRQRPGLALEHDGRKLRPSTIAEAARGPAKQQQMEGGAMKLYMHPASTTSRAVMLFLADAKIDLEQQQVDVFKGEQYGG